MNAQVSTTCWPLVLMTLIRWPRANCSGFALARRDLDHRALAAWPSTARAALSAVQAHRTKLRSRVRTRHGDRGDRPSLPYPPARPPGRSPSAGSPPRRWPPPISTVSRRARRWSAPGNISTASGAGRGAPARRRAAARPAARRPDRGQGSDRHRRHADRLWLADLSRPPAGRGRLLRRARPRRRRGRPRQDRHDRVRHASPPARPPTRTTRRTPRAARRAARPRRSPTAWCRSPSARQTAGSVIRPGGLLRLRRLQAELRLDPPRRGQAAGRQPRHDRRVGPHRRGRGVLRRRASPAGRRCATLPCRSAAAFRPLPHADVGRGRAEHGRRARPRRAPRSNGPAPWSPKSPSPPEHRGAHRGAGHDHGVRAGARPRP